MLDVKTTALVTMHGTDHAKEWPWTVKSYFLDIIRASATAWST